MESEGGEEAEGEKRSKKRVKDGKRKEGMEIETSSWSTKC